MKKLRVAMIGVGAISGIYLENCFGMFSKDIELIGVCDLVREKAEAAQAMYPSLTVYPTMHDAFADSRVEVILNLTRPYEHFDVSMEALKAGKHVYSEKPLAATYDEGQKLVTKAQEMNLLLGGAPDTFLGAGLQTCRKIIDSGLIGDPIGGAAFMICHGHETWHPDPAFYYQYGGGPLMDMGPYYLTALVSMLGRVKTVSGFAKTTFETRTITSEPKHGEIVQVDVPTWINGLLQFENGASVTLFTTFDVYYPNQARLEIYGTKGTLILPDPNTFSGPIKLLRPEDGSLKEMPLMASYPDNSRGLGLSDMGKALRNGDDFRASSNQTLHVLEIMEKIIKSSQEGVICNLETGYEVKKPLNE